MQYPEETLKKVQKLEKDILKDFDDVCKKLNVEYIVMYGSGIGVERHKDFIPWDDDIDVGIMRSDLALVLKEIKKEYADKYLILNFDENHNFPITNTQIILKGTKFIVPEFEGVDCEFGIYLDVFPLDYVSDNPKEAKKQLKRAWKYSKMVILINMGTPKITFKGIKGSCVRMACRVINAMFRLFRVSNVKMYNKFLKVATKYEDTSRIGFLSSTIPGTEIFDKKDLFPTVYKPFGDMMVKMPANDDRVLKQLYGDYMTMPSVEQRVNHYPIVLDFGKY